MADAYVRLKEVGVALWMLMGQGGVSVRGLVKGGSGCGVGVGVGIGIENGKGVDYLAEVSRTDMGERWSLLSAMGILTRRLRWGESGWYGRW